MYMYMAAAILHGQLPFSFTDLGVPARSGIFPSASASAPTWTVGDLLKHAPARNIHLVQHVERHHPHAETIWEQGIEAEATGALGPAQPLEMWESSPNVIFCRKLFV